MPIWFTSAMHDGIFERGEQQKISFKKAERLHEH